MGNLNTSVKIGEMDRRITLKSHTTTIDDFGQVLDDTETTTEVWAKVEWEGGKEKDSSGKESTLWDYAFTVRYLSTVDSQTVVEFESEDYDIEHIEQINRRSHLRLMCIKRD